jgi:hypothetical protein
MAPYRGVRYHLKEHRQANQKPQNSKELFNLRHSSLRNVIERIFGVLKRQWQVIGGKGCEYSIPTQIDLFCGVIGVYNFAKQQGDSNLFEDDIDIEAIQEEPQIESQLLSQAKGRLMMEKKRDEIAERMWKDYLLIRDK